jgi:hypothetical protein
MRIGRSLALVVALAASVIIGHGVNARTFGAKSGGSTSGVNPKDRASQEPAARSRDATTRLAPIAAATSMCPDGSRALNMTNHCNFDVWFAEDPSAAPGGTPTCPDPTNAGNDNFGCPTGTTCNNGGVCVTSCNDPGTPNAPDCGPNQTCFDGGFKQMPIGMATPAPIYECFANYFEPTPISSPTPSSGSGWDLAANGGQSVVCVPEANPTSGSAPGQTCSVNTDCLSYECMSKGTDAMHSNLPGNFCLPSESGCQCANIITWSGNFWGRTHCELSGESLSCETGDCGDKLECTTGPPPPATLTEMTLLAPSNPDNSDSYDISMVSGFNVGYSMQPVAGTYSGTCGSPGVGCSFDINANCPSELQLLAGDKTTVLGCYTPDKACAASNPAALNCSGTVPFLCRSDADCPYGHQALGARRSMECSGAGQCVCRLASDCPQGFTCAGGSCTPMMGTSAAWTDLYGCSGFYNLSPLNSNIFPAWLMNTGQETGITCGCPAWSANCLAHNYNWETAPLGNSGPSATATPVTTVESYFKVFHDGCSTAYSYAYDDSVGSAGCQPSPSASTGASYNIDFCPASSATPTAINTPTATATATPTATPTPTPSPAATPACTPDIYLTTNPAGTLAFGDVVVGNSVMLPLMVTNNESFATLKLTAKIRHRDAEDFALAGGTCVANNKLSGGSSCTYQLKLKADKSDEGGAVSADFVVTGRYAGRVCPKRDIQRVSVTLAGAVLSPATRSRDSRR